MKILYIANDRRAAELAAFVLSTVAPDVAVTWVASLADARHWIDENRDVATLIVEVESDPSSCESFVSHVRGLGVTAPVIVVSVKDPAPPLMGLKAVADEVVTKVPLFLHDLPDIVRRTLQKPRPPGRPARRRVRLLYVGDAALARECLGRPGGSIEVVGAVPGVNGKFDPLPADVRPGVPLPFEIVLIEHGHPGVETLAILKDVGSRKLHVPVVIVADWDEELAVLALKLGASDYVVKSKASFRAVYFRLNRLIAHSALLNEQSRLRDAHAAAVDQERANRDDLVGRLVDVQRARENAEQRLNEAVAAIKQARQARLADAVGAAEEHVRRECDFAARLAEATAATQRLEQQLADRDAALRHAEQRATAKQQTASQDFARRQTELESALREEVARRRALETKLAEAEVSQQAAEQRWLAAAAASADKLAQQNLVFTTSIAQAAGARDAFEQRLNEAVAAIEQAHQDRAADAAAAAQHLSQREAALLSRLGNAAATQEQLERHLADADRALQYAQERAAAEQHAARQQATERQTEVEAELARETANREALRQQLVDAKIAFQRTEERHASEATAADARFAEHQARSDARVSEAAATLDVLQARLVAAESALQAASRRHASEMAAAAAHLADHQQQAETWLAEAAAATDALERRLADSAEALAHAERRASVERRTAFEEAAQRHAKFETELTREVSNRQALAEALAAAEAARHHADEQHMSQLTAAAAQVAEYRKEAEAQMAQVAADAAAALQTAERHAAAERQAAAEQAVQCQAAFETELSQEIAQRQAVEAKFAEARAASEQAQVCFLDEIAGMRQGSREHETRLAERAAEERAEWERTRVEAQERIRHLQMEGDLARQSLVGTEERIQQLESAHKDEQAHVERARMAMESDLARQRGEYTALHQILDQTRATAQETLERLSRDRAIERARLEALVAERETKLREQAARKLASDEAAATTVADVEHRLHVTLAARDRDSRAIAQLDEQLKAVGEELEATRRQGEVLKAAADRVPQLQKQIDNIRAENRRQFDHTPVNMCRCSRDGAITQVNHALASLLGYATPEEVQRLDFAGTVFESGDELQWIVDRCLGSRSTESVETTWRKKDGSRIIVRVMAVATAADSIDLVAEEITRVRVLEENLRNSQRMEAVARYGSEVAVTCHTLLRHVKQEGQQWLAGIESDTARYQGELLLDDVTRAAGFLGQLAAYGNEQKNVPDLVDVNKVLRDMGPVLKRVAGDNIELVLPKASTPLNLDVEAGRVERMLVNVAAYGRERMPLGGRLMIEVASVVVDRTFVAKYPNVRPGAHVLLTVNEARGAVRPDFSAAVRTQASGANATASPSDNPGVDLGALQALVSDCGGHLWMMAEPPGDMVLKIHLPRRVLDRPDPRAPAKRPGRSRWIHRAFSARH
jgi:PAS domain S-box-containing protein